MKQIYLIAALKLLSLMGAVANTVGFASFFVWKDVLEPYRWPLILGGWADGR